MTESDLPVETPTDVRSDAEERPIDPPPDAAEQDGDELPGFGGPPEGGITPPASDAPDADRKVPLGDDDRRS